MSQMLKKLILKKKKNEFAHNRHQGNIFLFRITIWTKFPFI